MEVAAREAKFFKFQLVTRKQHLPTDMAVTPSHSVTLCYYPKLELPIYVIDFEKCPNSRRTKDESTRTKSASFPPH